MRRFACLACGLAALLAIVSVSMGCSFPFQSGGDAQITDIRNDLTFRKISRQGFMGGSVLYNPDKPATGQLAKDVTVAVRLGYVDKENDGSGEVVFKDNEDAARYGYITISFIDKDEISFTYVSYGKDGLYKNQMPFSIKQGESIDINSDGLVDLKYDYPIRKRASFENAIWLTFLSNQDTQNTAMFAVMPEQYSRGVYPSGIMGINPYGKFIVNKYEVNSTNRAAVQGATYGDYVLDSQTGEYQKITSNFSYRNARAIDDSELETVVETSQTDFYFSANEFDDFMTAENLLSKLPIEVVKDMVYAEHLSAIDMLNRILELRFLLNEMALANDLPTDTAEILELINTLETAAQQDVVEFNRYLLEAFYPNQCPPVDIGNNDITSIFPLLSVLISNPDTDVVHVGVEAQRSAGTIGTANSYNSYLSQKQAIDDAFSSFYPIKNFSYDFPGWKNLCKELEGRQTIDTNSQPTKEVDLRGNVGAIEDIASVLTTQPKTDIPGKIENRAKLKLGVMGHFKSTFGNIEGGIYAGVYISADTSLDMSKILAEYPVKDVPKLSISTEEKLIDINIKLFDAPPINIGVVSLKFSLNGGLEIPASIKLTGTVTTNLYAGFTGFYAAGFDVGANYGVKTKKIKIWRITITIPTGFYFDPYAKGGVINKTASFVGPVSDVTTIPGLKLQSGKLELCTSPSVYVEPGITIANCLYGGIKIGPYVDLGLGLQFNIDDIQQLPKNLELYSVFGVGINVEGIYGLNITIPIVNKSVDRTGSVNFTQKDFVETKRRTINTIAF